MSIVFIAADADTVRTYQAALPTDNVMIVEALSGDAYRKVRPMDEKGGVVFAAFGLTTIALRREGVKNPIVEIELTSGDMVEALMEAKALTHSEQPLVAVIGFNHMVQNLIAFKPFLNLRVNCYVRASAEDARMVVERAIAEGAQVILGGTTSARLARERHIPAVRLRPRNSSILAAYEEAAQIEYARGLDDHRSSELKAILEYTDQGIIAINSEQRITVFNPAAQRITGIREEDVLGSLVQKTFPFLRFKETMQGQEKLGQIVEFGHATVIMNRVPVRVATKVVGAVATLQDITAIQAMEARIRREMYSKGHVAKFAFQDIVGQSPMLRDAMDKAASYATVDSTVLIHGETGVGKELFAQGIHRASRRKANPFVAVNCAALPENLLESELFGYVEGAFTGARRQGKPGLFELAHGGTIFLDEVSEIPLSLQGRLLRVLQEREVVRLGHDRVIPIDVRVLCATNREIRRLVEAGSFRNDLYWRLNVLSLTVPPLRERPCDVRLLIEYFLGSQNRECCLKACFTEASLDFLSAYPWPGNVRELRNFCERVMVGPQDRRLEEKGVRQLCDQGIPLPLERVCDDGNRIQSAMVQAGGRIDQAAKHLGVHRSTLWRWRQKIQRPSARSGQKPCAET
jgi:PAS domain S-box-containing protein